MISIPKKVNVIEKHGRTERLIFRGKPDHVRSILEEKFNERFEKNDLEYLDPINYEVSLDKKRRSLL